MYESYALAAFSSQKSPFVRKKTRKNVDEIDGRINFLPSSLMHGKEVMIRLGTRQEMYLTKLLRGKILKIDASYQPLNKNFGFFQKLFFLKPQN